MEERLYGYISYEVKVGLIFSCDCFELRKMIRETKSKPLCNVAVHGIPEHLVMTQDS